MFIRLLLLFTVLPVVELYLLIRLGTAIGGLPTIALVIITGIVGARLARSQGFSVLQKIRQKAARGESPASEMVDGLCILVAGIVLLTPGILTDLGGVLLLVPASREVLKRVISRSLAVAAARGTVSFTEFTTFTGGVSHGPGGSPPERPVEEPETTFFHDHPRGRDFEDTEGEKNQ
ncbi:FxsA family protein [Alkalispirochaeta sphaeroplastigenens]|uniref:FxsA family protein n=1 Tax=Alkalispirochaeta sphaeroplastigenens TaxID=1187066 RepID=UPI000CDA2E94|nr:FxsA family protein [Alkalispirochaeta sphaeroplastigenens]